MFSFSAGGGSSWCSFSDDSRCTGGGIANSAAVAAAAAAVAAAVAAALPDRVDVAVAVWGLAGDFVCGCWDTGITAGVAGGLALKSSAVLGRPSGMPAFNAGTFAAEDKDTSVDRFLDVSSTTSLAFRLAGIPCLVGDGCGRIAGDALAATGVALADFRNLFLIAASRSAIEDCLELQTESSI